MQVPALPDLGPFLGNRRLQCATDYALFGNGKGLWGPGTTVGGTESLALFDARRLEEVGRGSLREILEDRAQPRAAHGW
jgi:hypothetical protein